MNSCCGIYSYNYIMKYYSFFLVFQCCFASSGGGLKVEEHEQKRVRLLRLLYLKFWAMVLGFWLQLAQLAEKVFNQDRLVLPKGCEICRRTYDSPGINHLIFGTCSYLLHIFWKGCKPKILADKVANEGFMRPQVMVGQVITNMDRNETHNKANHSENHTSLHTIDKREFQQSVSSRQHGHKQ